ncbi:hypothetical protein K1719_029236 [Acacia pycnantha]|nr:hypothetical protein K1719_029236 [Acacia pycnantha]
MKKEIEMNLVMANLILATLQKYCIALSGLQYFVDHDDNCLYKCLNTKHVKNLMPEEMLKDLVERAEILELSEMREARWKCLNTTVELEVVPSFIGIWEASTSPVLKTRARGWFRGPAGSSKSWRGRGLKKESTHSNTGQAMPHLDIQTHTGEAKGKQVIEASSSSSGETVVAGPSQILGIGEIQEA